MCCAKTDAVAALDAATVGVFAFVGNDGLPRGCAVTPYLDAGQALVTSTLAFTAKVAAVRRDPRVALLAGGCLVRGRAALDVDLTSKTFRRDGVAQHRSLAAMYLPARRPPRIPAHAAPAVVVRRARVHRHPPRLALGRQRPDARPAIDGQVNLDGRAGARPRRSKSLPLDVNPARRDPRSRSAPRIGTPPACSSTTQDRRWHRRDAAPATTLHGHRPGRDLAASRRRHRSRCPSASGVITIDQSLRSTASRLRAGRPQESGFAPLARWRSGKPANRKLTVDAEGTVRSR